MSANDDRALVVGITAYPTLQPLNGSENDADDFHAWLISAAGGGVDPGNVTRIVSSMFQPPLQPAPTNQPRAGDIEAFFDGLHREAVAANGVARRLGRRLYVYVAGHGAALSFNDDPEQRDAVLLTADATRWIASHVMTRLYAVYFLNAKIFDEVVVFMDCCRTPYSKLNPRHPPYIDINALNAGRSSYFAFATRWGHTAREKMINGRQRGIFTTALLAGLRGAAADDDGRVTSSSLSGYLQAHMRDFLTDADREDPTVPQEPDIIPNGELLFATCPQPRGKVEVRLRPGLDDDSVRILGDQFKSVFEWPAGTAGPLRCELPRGNYLVQANSRREAAFRVIAGETTHVDL